jgi:hypothetical protein
MPQALEIAIPKSNHSTFILFFHTVNTHSNINRDLKTQGWRDWVWYVRYVQSYSQSYRSNETGLTWRPTVPSEDGAFTALRTAVTAGCTFLNGGEFYGTSEPNSLTLLNKYYAKYPDVER